MLVFNWQGKATPECLDLLVQKFCRQMPMPSAFPIFFGRPNFNFDRPNYFTFSQKKFGRPKKNLVVQKFFFIVFSYEIDVFG